MYERAVTMKRKKSKVPEIIGLILVLSLAASVVFSLIRFIKAPAELAEGEPYTKVKSDYLLMLIHCLASAVLDFAQVENHPAQHDLCALFRVLILCNLSRRGIRILLSDSP